MSVHIAEDTVEVLNIRMSRPAAVRVFKALVWAADEAQDHGRPDDYEWLVWACGRIATAQGNVEEPRDE